MKIKYSLIRNVNFSALRQWEFKITDVIIWHILHGLREIENKNFSNRNDKVEILKAIQCHRLVKNSN